MANYITTADFKHFQPMNANFGLFPPLGEKIKNKKLKNEKIALRAIEKIQNFSQNEYNSTCK
jgi:methylenetetrahydrofolate--tRNA-(uracil-5-)-methyltransferase